MEIITHAHGLIGLGTGHNLRMGFLFFFIMFPPLENGQIAQ